MKSQVSCRRNGASDSDRHDLDVDTEFDQHFESARNAAQISGNASLDVILNESTLKTFAQGPRGSFSLKAENSRYQDLFPVAELTIQGVVRALIRRLR